MYNQIEDWGKYLSHVKRNIKGQILNWHPCHFFSDHECSQDSTHLLEKEHRMKKGLKPLIW